MNRDIPINLENAFRRTLDALKLAYAPYSQFAVGATVVTNEGQLFSASNMENSSYGLTACAELGALQAASSAGKLAEIQSIVVIGGSIRKSHKISSNPVPPCGRCRQLIAEAARLGGYDIEVWYSNIELDSIRHSRISQLLPDAFQLDTLR